MYTCSITKEITSYHDRNVVCKSIEQKKFHSFSPIFFSFFEFEISYQFNKTDQLKLLSVFIHSHVETLVSGFRYLKKVKAIEKNLLTCIGWYVDSGTPYCFFVGYIK